MDGDCWFLYTLNHAGNASLVGVKQPDQTLEILMTDLDKDAMREFTLLDENGVVRHPEAVTKVPVPSESMRLFRCYFYFWNVYSVA